MTGVYMSYFGLYLRTRGNTHKRFKYNISNSLFSTRGELVSVRNDKTMLYIVASETTKTNQIWQRLCKNKLQYRESRYIPFILRA